MLLLDNCHSHKLPLMHPGSRSHSEGKGRNGFMSSFAFSYDFWWTIRLWHQEKPAPRKKKITFCLVVLRELMKNVLLLGGSRNGIKMGPEYKRSETSVFYSPPFSLAVRKWHCLSYNMWFVCPDKYLSLFVPDPTWKKDTTWI